MKTAKTTLPYVGYVRVSSADQATSGLSLEAQRDKLIALGVTRDIAISEIVIDAAESAKSLDRPGIQRIIAMVKAGQIAGIVIAKLDRLTRSLADLDMLTKLFNETGTNIISCDGVIDMSTAIGRMVLNLVTTVSQWEREAISERTVAAMDSLRKGNFRTGVNAPYGWKSDIRTPEERKAGIRKELEPERKEQEVIQIVLKMRGEGKTFQKISDTLNQMGYRTRPTKNGKDFFEDGGLWTMKSVHRIWLMFQRAEAA